MTPKAINSQPSPRSSTPSDSVEKSISELERAIRNNTASSQLKNVYTLLEQLPPKIFRQNADGSLSRINEEKNGRELYTKFIDAVCFADSMYGSRAPEILGDVIDWLINQQLLKASEIDEQGYNPLDQLILAFSNKLFSTISLKHMVDTWLNQGALLTLNKASRLLKVLVENSKFDLKKHNYAVDFLTKQGAILEDNTKVTSLLQKAVEKRDRESYKTLLNLGADPNIEIPTVLYGKVAILHVLGQDVSKEGQEMFQLLVKNSKTNINITNHKGLTLAMEESYEHKFGLLPSLIDYLLQREDFDINEIKAGSSAIGIKDFTLLDMVIDNCSMILSGGESKMIETLHNNKKWLGVLKKISKHKNYFVDDSNLKLIKKKIYRLEQQNFYNSAICADAIAVAEEALNILESGPKKK
jgi:hypothetical protein